MKVAIYCRLSEEDRNKRLETDDSESIQNQKSLLIQHAMEEKWDIYNIYSDDDYAGADRNRPQFNELLRDAELHKFDIILCKSQSRFTREMEYVEKYIHGLFPIWNIRFVSVVDHADTDVKGNKKARQINGLINEWYLEDMSENIKSVLTNKRENGHHIGAFALYGYKKDENQKGHLVIDETAAEVVREVFTLFSQGYGKTAIARMLNDKGIPNPTEYKRISGLRYAQPKTKTSTLWKYFAISDMLSNEIYIGNMVQGKYKSISYKTKQNRPVPKQQWIRVEGTHEPIIELELWNKVQKLLDLRAKPFVNGTIGLFAKKTKCKHCGYILRSSQARGLHYLKCPTRHVAKDACIGSFVSVNTLEKCVVNELNHIINKYLDKNEVERQIEFNNGLNEVKSKLLKEKEYYIKKIEQFTKGIKTLYLDKIKGIITEEEYSEFSNDFTVDKRKFEVLLKKADEQIDQINQKQQDEYSHKQFLNQYMGIEKLDRETVDKLIDYIYIGKRNPDTNELPIEIHWNF